MDEGRSAAIAGLPNVLRELFNSDEDVREWILIGRLPADIAEIAAVACVNKGGETHPVSLGSPPEYMRLGELLQKRFFPNAPKLEKGGFHAAILGIGPMPDWVLHRQLASQIVEEVRKWGYEVPLAEIERITEAANDTL